MSSNIQNLEAGQQLQPATCCDMVSTALHYAGRAAIGTPAFGATGFLGAHLVNFVGVVGAVSPVAGAVLNATVFLVALATKPLFELLKAQCRESSFLKGLVNIAQFFVPPLAALAVTLACGFSFTVWQAVALAVSLITTPPLLAVAGIGLPLLIEYALSGSSNSRRIEIAPLGENQLTQLMDFLVDLPQEQRGLFLNSLRSALPQNQYNALVAGALAAEQEENRIATSGNEEAAPENNEPPGASRLSTISEENSVAASPSNVVDRVVQEEQQENNDPIEEAAQNLAASDQNQEDQPPASNDNNSEQS